MKKLLTLLLVLTLGGPALPAQAPATGTAADKTAEKAPATPQRPPVKFKLDDAPLDRTNRTRITSYADVLERVTPAVVSVYSAKRVQVAPNQTPPGLEELLRRFYGLPPGRAPQQRPQQEEPVERTVPFGMGSGCIVTSDGYILTNHHVVTIGRTGELADKITVSLPDGREFEAQVVGTDAKTDVAVLKIEAQNLPTLTIAGSGGLRVGDIVFAVGNPLKVGLTVTQGIVSATGRSNLGILGYDAYESFIQTDAAINVGNSGGPLVDAQGRLVGLNTAILSGSGGSIGIGFAIPSDLARGVMLAIVEKGEVRRGFLGIGIQDLDPHLAQAMGLTSTRGALVNRIQKGMPAEKAGLRREDVIISVDDDATDSAAELRFQISRRSPGSVVQLKVIRSGKEVTIPVTLGDRDEGGTAVPGAPATRQLMEGVSMEPLNQGLRKELGLEEDVEGLVISQVEPGSPYGEFLRPGMLILEINQQKVKTLADAQKVLRNGPNVFYIYTDGRYAYLTLTVTIPRAKR